MPPVRKRPSTFGQTFVQWLACLAVAVVYGWPFVVLHGVTALAVGIPWLALAVFATLLALAARSGRRPRR